MSLPWFRLYSEDLRKPPLATMPAADRWDFIRLLGIANEEPMRGWLPPVKDIAFLLRMSEGKVISLLHRLMALHLVEKDQGVNLYAIANRKRFFPKGDDSTQRVRRHRAGNGGGNGEGNGVSVRDSHALDIERDGEEEGAREEGEGDLLPVLRRLRDCGIAADREAIREAISHDGGSSECLLHCVDEAVRYNRPSLAYALTIFKRHQEKGCPEPGEERLDRIISGQF